MAGKKEGGLIEDKLVDKWSANENKRIIIGAEDPILGLVSGPFRTIKSAKTFVKLWGALKKWKGHNLPSWLSKNQARSIIQKTSDATGVPKGKLFKFAEQKVSGSRQSIKENRRISLKHGKGFREARGEGTKLFGGWKGGMKYKGIKKSINDKDMTRFLNDAIAESTKR